MPTQKPFLSNFLAAFRTHSQPLVKPAPALTTSTTSTATSAATLWTSTKSQTQQQPPPASDTPTSPRPINPKHPPVAQTLQHTVSPTTHLPSSPVYGPPNKPGPSYPSVQESRRARRGSDSSSEGFRDVRGAGEKWFIGGKTAGGEEKYYKLAMVRRERSADRCSADRLSL